jgi:hypothetical protein
VTTKPSAAYVATERALGRKLSELNWAQTPLDSALNEIERGSGVTIKYDLDSLRHDGINPAQRVVTAPLGDVRAAEALEVVLPAASQQGSPPSHGLTMARSSTCSACGR